VFERRSGGPTVEDYLVSFRRRAGDLPGLRRVLRRCGYLPREAAIAVSLITLGARVASAQDASAGRVLRAPMESLVAACERTAGGRRGRHRSRRFGTLRRDVWTLVYRLASQAESGVSVDRRWALTLFDRLSRTPGLTPDLRGGAFFHLARLHLSCGRTASALASAARCLELIPAHDEAARLLDAQQEAA
jgi:hypothetical protein